MSYYQKYNDLKHSYLQIQKLFKGGSENQMSVDEIINLLIESRLNKLQEKIQIAKDKIQEKERKIEDLKNMDNIKMKNPQQYKLLLKDIFYYHDFDKDGEIVESEFRPFIVPQEYRHYVKKLGGLTDFEVLKDYPMVEEISMGEFFVYNDDFWQKELPPGTIHDRIKSIEFTDFDRLTLVEGSLPKNLEKLSISEYIKIDTSVLPKSLKILYTWGDSSICDPNNIPGSLIELWMNCPKQKSLKPSEDSDHQVGGSDESKDGITKFINMKIERFGWKMDALRKDIKNMEELYKRYNQIDHIKSKDQKMYDSLIKDLLTEIELFYHNGKIVPIQLLSTELRNKVETVSNVENLSILKSFRYLQEIGIGGPNITKDIVIEPHMFPPYVKKITFYDFGKYHIKEDALPETLEDIYLPSTVTLEGSLPKGLKHIKATEEKPIKSFYRI